MPTIYKPKPAETKQCACGCGNKFETKRNRVYFGTNCRVKSFYHRKRREKLLFLEENKDKILELING